MKYYLDLNEMRFDGNIFKNYPHFKSVAAFKALEDEETNANNASKLMWSIILLYHKKSPYANLPELERKAKIAEDFLKNPNFDWEDEVYSKACKTYYDLYLTELERTYIDIKNKLSERRRFISEQSYTLDEYEMDNSGKPKLVKGTAAQLDKMIVDLDKILKLMKQIEMDLEREEEDMKKDKSVKPISTSKEMML